MPREKRRGRSSSQRSSESCPPVLLLLLVAVFIVLALSQIFLVTNTKHIEFQKKVKDWRILQSELRDLDKTMRNLLLNKNIPSIETNRRILQNEINAVKIAGMIEDQENSKFAKVDSNNSKPESNSSRTSASISTEIVNQTTDVFMNESSVSHRTSRLLNQSIITYSNISVLSNSRKLENTTSSDQGDFLKYCPEVPPHLVGAAMLSFEHSHSLTIEDITKLNPDVRPGGMWKPRDCLARHRVGVIIPYRDRHEHLMVLLSHLIPIFKRQQLDYRIFVVEQIGTDTFNKASLMNAAFIEALKMHNFQCFVFHDVDLIPEDDRNMYTCPSQPRHMSVAIDEMGYKLAYQELVGGVLNLRTEHFQKVNGYSNLYWGWGAEDDDMAYRIMHVGLKITRPPEKIARYKMIRHTKRRPVDWRKRNRLLHTGTRRFHMDGLNSLSYKIVFIKKEKLFTHIMIDLGKPPKGF